MDLFCVHTFHLKLMLRDERSALVSGGFVKKLAVYINLVNSALTSTK